VAIGLTHHQHFVLNELDLFHFFQNKFEKVAHFLIPQLKNEAVIMWDSFDLEQAEKQFVPILYRVLAFDAFDDFSAFVKSINYEYPKPVNNVVRIHAGEPLPSAPAESAHFVPSPVSATFRVFLRAMFSLVGREISTGASSTPGLRPNPTFSPANSPVSRVDRTRLLTASPAQSASRMARVGVFVARCRARA